MWREPSDTWIQRNWIPWSWGHSACAEGCLQIRRLLWLSPASHSEWVKVDQAEEWIVRGSAAPSSLCLALAMCFRTLECLVGHSSLAQITVQFYMYMYVWRGLKFMVKLGNVKMSISQQGFIQFGHDLFCTPQKEHGLLEQTQTLRQQEKPCYLYTHTCRLYMYTCKYAFWQRPLTSLSVCTVWHRALVNILKVWNKMPHCLNTLSKGSQGELSSAVFLTRVGEMSPPTRTCTCNFRLDNFRMYMYVDAESLLNYM